MQNDESKSNIQDDDESDGDPLEKQRELGDANFAPGNASASKVLPRFEISEFYGLNVSSEVKELLDIMQK